MRFVRSLPAALIAALLLTGCGTTEDSGGSNPSDNASDAATDAAAPDTDTGPITVTDDRGTVTLDAPATKVVSLEWGLTENLLTLGVQPVGAADVKGYNTWDKSIALEANTPDVGMRGEPSLDAIAALEPDLVVTTTDLTPEVLGQIEAEYPVIALRGSDGEDPIGHMRRTINTLGEATGTTDKAEAVLAAFDADVAAAKEQLTKAGVAGASYTMADGWIADGAVSIRMYTTGSFLGAIGAELGLVNAWTQAGDADYGLAQTDVEGLTGLGAGAHFLYTASDADGGDPFTVGLGENAIWKQLPFVVAGNVTRLPDGIWMFGGPASASGYINAIVAALTSAS